MVHQLNLKKKLFVSGKQYLSRSLNHLFIYLLSMKWFIKKILRESLLPEADVDTHTYDRIGDRIAKISDADLSSEAKGTIFRNLKKIETIDFPKNKSYVVFLGEFTPNPESKYFEVYKGNPYYKLEGSIGNQFWAIVRKNKIDTFMLAMEYQTKNPMYNAERLNVDYSIKNIDKFAEQQPKQKNPEVETEPIILINGVKWIVNIKDETIHKKNNPAVKHKIEDILDNIDTATQEKVLAYF